MRITDILKEKGFAVTVEVDPPAEPSLGGLIEGVRRLRDSVDAINVSERKAYRMNSVITACQLRERAKVETIFHVTCRDWNRRAMFGLLLSAWGMGLKNALAVFGDRDELDNVYDFRSSYSLIKFMRSMNEGVYDREKKVGRTGFCIGAGVNPCAGPQKEAEKLLKAFDCGMNFVQTQPVYFPERFLEFRDQVKSHGIKAPVLAGVMPLKSERSPMFLESKLGIPVGEEIKRRMRGKGHEEGVAIAGEIIEELREGSDGIHIYPMGNLEAALKLANLAKEIPVEN